MININEINLTSIKKEMTERVVSKLIQTKYMSIDEKESYKQKLLSLVNSKHLATTVRNQSGLTNADDYNQTAYELYLDLMTVFTYLDELDGMINSHIQLNQSIIGSIQSNIGGLNDRLEECVAVMSSVGSPKCYIEGFRNANNQEVDKRYYTERYGERVLEQAYSRYNQDQENLTLDYARKQNVMTYGNNIQLGTVNITKQYGAGFITARNDETRLDNCIDTSMSTYWCETILTNQEIKVSGDGFNSSDTLGQYNRSFYDLPKGAMCEICFTFEAMAKVNEIDLTPFGSFPIDVIAIRYSLTDDEDAESYDVLAPKNIIHPWLIETSVKNPCSFHFPEIICKKLYILINQLHCIKNTYLISSNQMFKNQLWFNATSKESTSDIEMKNTDVFVPMYLEKAEQLPVWKYINNKMVKNKKLDLNQLLITSSEKTLPVTKYEYVYGFYNIAPNYVEFQKAGVYVTKEISVGGSVKTVRLITDEEHNPSPEGLIVTDIEFYITSKQNPSYTDWHPIRPIQKKYIHKELLQLDYAYCYLRHKAVCGNRIVYDKNGNEKMEMVRPIVYMNDIVLTEDADYILRFDDDLNVIAIEISNIDHFSLFTVDYEPIDASKELALVDDINPIPNNSYEELLGNGTACYELTGYPYYNANEPTLTNTHLRLINVRNSQVINETSTFDSMIQCVTDKNNPSASYRNFTVTNKIQYYTNGKHLYFNKPITSLEKIEINYPAFDSSIRLKAILRRNTKRDSWITPILKSFKLEFTVV